MSRRASDVSLQRIKWTPYSVHISVTLLLRSEVLRKGKRNWERCPEENSQLVTLDFEELAVERMKCGLAPLGARISVAGVKQQESMFVQCSVLTSHEYGRKVYSCEVHFPGPELAGESGRRVVATKLILRTA